MSVIEKNKQGEIVSILVEYKEFTKEQLINLITEKIKPDFDSLAARVEKAELDCGIYELRMQMVISALTTMTQPEKKNNQIHKRLKHQLSILNGHYDEFFRNPKAI